MSEIKVGDKVIICKPKNTKSWPRWIKIMDEYDGREIVIEEIFSSSAFGETVTYVMHYDGWRFNTKWLIPATELGNAIFS